MTTTQEQTSEGTASMTRPYEIKRYERFAREIERSGREVTHYRGKFFYEGPAVIVDDIQDAIRATKVKCQWDNLGKGFIVYPA